MERYAGKPFLRLLECYVLWSAGEITPDDDQKLAAMTPKLQQLYKCNGSWQEIVAAEMEFPPDLPTQIKLIWTENKERALKNSMVLRPEEFAKMFVDQNFDVA